MDSSAGSRGGQSIERRWRPRALRPPGERHFAHDVRQIRAPVLEQDPDHAVAQRALADHVCADLERFAGYRLERSFVDLDQLLADHLLAPIERAQHGRAAGLRGDQIEILAVRIDHRDADGDDPVLAGAIERLLERADRIVVFDLSALRELDDLGLVGRVRDASRRRSRPRLDRLMRVVSR